MFPPPRSSSSKIPMSSLAHISPRRLRGVRARNKEKGSLLSCAQSTFFAETNSGTGHNPIPSLPRGVVCVCLKDLKRLNSSLAYSVLLQGPRRSLNLSWHGLVLRCFRTQESIFLPSRNSSPFITLARVARADGVSRSRRTTPGEDVNLRRLRRGGRHQRPGRPKPGSTKGSSGG